MLTSPGFFFKEAILFNEIPYHTYITRMSAYLDTRHNSTDSVPTSKILIRHTSGQRAIDVGTESAEL